MLLQKTDISGDNETRADFLGLFLQIPAEKILYCYWKWYLDFLFPRQEDNNVNALNRKTIYNTLKSFIIIYSKLMF